MLRTEERVKASNKVPRRVKSSCWWCRESRCADSLSRSTPALLLLRF